MVRRRTLERVRADMRRVRGNGFLVTWDVDSRDRSSADRIAAFLWGKRVRGRDREYVYQGFIGSEGVRYLGQSVLFVLPHRLEELRAFLTKCGVLPIVDSIAFF